MRYLHLCICSIFVLITGCSSPQQPTAPIATPTEIAALANGLRSLGPEVDPSEATRAAKTAFEHAHRLSVQYQVTDPPLIHNTKVNLGLRARGLCWHWARDMQTHLKKSGFKTLDLHMARSKPEPFRIGHSTIILSAKNDPHTAGIVLDPWRYGGNIFWSATQADPKYVWLLETEVLETQHNFSQKQINPVP